MMLMSLIHHQQQQQQRRPGLLIAVVLCILILFCECVITQRNENAETQHQQQKTVQSIPKISTTTTTTTTAGETDSLVIELATNEAKTNVRQSRQLSDEAQLHQQQQQQRDQQQPTIIGNNATSTSTSSTQQALQSLSSASISTSSTSSSSSSSSSTTTVNTPPTRKNLNETLRNGESFEETDHSSAEVDDFLGSIAPTTYRPARPSIAPHTSAQERERKLMNVLAARRSALHHGGFRTRIGTTGRTATSSNANVETTSRSPTDPNSVCVRNCTKNFTRRTTASCMRQCDNFSRSTQAVTNQQQAKNGVKIFIRPSSKNGGNISRAAASEQRDTNEILFTDESSHGLFVVAKEQNDTVNHIPDVVKGAKILRQRGKPTTPQSSIEDDDIQPYLYFGQKLPPIKPDTLTITSVSDEHPKLLEVSVAQIPSTIPTIAPLISTVSTSTLSAVERSRSRFKYQLRDRGTTSLTRRSNSNININTRNVAALLNENSTENKTTTTTTTTTTTSTPTTTKPNEPITLVKSILPKTELIKGGLPSGLASRSDNFRIDSSTTKPTIKTISSTPLIITVLSDEEQEMSTTPQTVQSKSSTSISTPTSTPTPPPLQYSTESAKTILPTTRSRTTSTTRSTPTTSTTTTATTTTFTTTTTTTSTTTTPRPMPTPIVIHESNIEENFRMLQEHELHNTDDDANIVVFLNRSVPTPSILPNAPTTDASSTILRTTILTSIRSTVNPRRESTSSTTSTTPSAAYIGVVETTNDIEAENNLKPNAIDIINTDNEDDVSYEMDRMNIATMVLAIIGIFPLMAVILYLVRTFIIKRHTKDDEDFDICIGDQQPISPVKKLDSTGHHINNDDAVTVDEIDYHKTIIEQHSLHSQPLPRDNGKRQYDEQGSVTSEQEFERSNIRLKSLLGEGNFGQVWKAEADDLNGHFGATRIVAVKTIRALSAQVSLKEEAEIMRKLGSHPNVVTLLGACVESEPHMLIMEYAMRGRLLSLLRAARSATNILPASVPGGRSLAPLSPRTLAGFAMDIACGMEYIASRRIVHRDLAARNVLLDHNGVCKICDFGMSIDLDAERKRKDQEKLNEKDIQRNNANKFKFDFAGRFILNHWNHNQSNQQQKEKEIEKKSNCQGHHGHHHNHHHHHHNHHNHHNGNQHGHDTVSKRHALPIRWMAPEALQYHVFTSETDVWAFGIVLWEVATLGSTPYSQYTGREVIRRVPNGLRPDLPKESRHEFYNLMSRCWQKDPRMRPTFTQARQEISRSLHKWVDDDSAASDYMDVSGFSEDLEQGMVYFNHRISEFECEI